MRVVKLNGWRMRMKLGALRALMCRSAEEHEVRLFRHPQFSRRPLLSVTACSQQTACVLAVLTEQQPVVTLRCTMACTEGWLHACSCAAGPPGAGGAVVPAVRGHEPHRAAAAAGAVRPLLSHQRRRALSAGGALLASMQRGCSCKDPVLDNPILF